VGGQVELNGEPRNLKRFKSISCHVRQVRGSLRNGSESFCHKED
jgi:hypothetical protein